MSIENIIKEEIADTANPNHDFTRRGSRGFVCKRNKWGGSGRWGVVPASQHQEILVALASLIRAQRYEMALTILDNELGGGC